jgi:hypothetical protein
MPPARGAPDVSADSGGNMFYKTPLKDMTGMSFDDGTSAATPLWGVVDGGSRYDLRRSGLAARGLRQRPAVHRGRHRPGVVQ